MPSGLMSERSSLPAASEAVATEENTHKPNQSTELKNAKVSTDRSGKEISGETFPAIRHGGSLLLAWQIRKRTVLLVGGGVVAAGRLTKILEADANCVLVAPRDGLSPEVKFRIFTESHPELTYRDRDFSFDTDFEGIDMVMTAIDDNPLSEAICQESRRRRIPVNIADVPPQCDFYFGSEIRDGPLQIVVSTNGKGPKISNQVRRRIQASLPKDVGRAIENVGTLRGKLRKIAPGVGGELGARRMKWMIDVCECFTIPQLAAMDERKMDEILDGWDGLSVPGGRKGCPLGYRRAETDAGCPWGFKKEDRVVGDSRVISALTGFAIGALGVWGYTRFLARS
ncbi:putative Siroheme synthase Met8 [Taphrina deformans PYCC 5710]|uniref:precorrin-2 dehydrogenase n=1 Tax=Taphrina deformans (strain PYCC 5710 / ATCC 11124 / CBS 356.35 / IMI 108563 / JCM 9778 / NBRC 8474) TaxID=1097556 RepID=R4XBC1_TAPDE|nr:putative Siroheme synthase Met8 [Taphrina deformans PYCC 5710]|eukprot:CCG80628.1 putative Siroheme synthase Met8 [Taphrina deformans PYCC 5710]